MLRLSLLVAVYAVIVIVCLSGLQGRHSQASVSLRRITNTAERAINLNPSLSGDGHHLAFESTEDLALVGGPETFRAIQTNLSLESVPFSQIGSTRAIAPAISRDGSRIAFASSNNPTGNNQDGNSEIFFFSGQHLKQLTDTSSSDITERLKKGSFQPSISDDGRLIAFSSNRDLEGFNADGNFEIFLFDTVANTFRQVTDSRSTVGATDAKISGDGSQIAFIRDNGASPSAQRDLVIQNRLDGTARVIASSLEKLALTCGRAISDDGLRVVYSAETATNSAQVFLYDDRLKSNTPLTALGARAGDVALNPTISGDGKRVAFATRSQVVGAKSDTGVELYCYDIPTAQFSKLTNAPANATVEVVSSLNDDGTVVAFNFARVLSAPVSSSELANNSEIYVATIPARPLFAPLTVLNAASLGNEPSGPTAVAPDSIVMAQGDALARLTEQAQPLSKGHFPLTLDGTTVTVNARAAELLFVSPTQVNFVCPPETEIGLAEVVVTNGEGFQSRTTVSVQTATPGLFTQSGDGRGSGVILDADTYQSGPFDPGNGARRSIVFATGLRHAASVSATIGSHTATVESVIPNPDLPGLDEVRLLLPPDIGPGTHTLLIRALGADSNAVRISISGNGGPTPTPTPTPSATPPPAIVISEFRTRGPNGANDEFIEIYNNTEVPTDIGGWKIKASNNSGAVGTRLTINVDTVIPARGHFLVTNSNGYGGSVTGDQTYGTGITNDGGIALTLANDLVVDQVGLSGGSAFKEGSILAPFSLDSNNSYERKPGGANGSTQDTDNNASDFQVVGPSDPQNLNSMPTPGSSPLPSPSPSVTPVPSPTPMPSPQPSPSPPPSPSPTPSPSADAKVVISQIYGGGGNAGAPLRNDFIEIFNAGNTAVTLSGWSVQYASATGTTWLVTNLTGVSLSPGHYYLIQEASGGGVGVGLPTPDTAGTVALAATAGKVALVSTTTALNGACPSGGGIVDMVGYGSSATCFEGVGPAVAPSNTNAVLRRGNGCTDTQSSANDFVSGITNPRSTLSGPNVCGGSLSYPQISQIPQTVSWDFGLHSGRGHRLFNVPRP